MYIITYSPEFGLKNHLQACQSSLQEAVAAPQNRSIVFY